MSMNVRTRKTVNYACDCARFEYEHACEDPKDGELCLRVATHDSTEARSDTDVHNIKGHSLSFFYFFYFYALIKIIIILLFIF